MLSKYLYSLLILSLLNTQTLIIGSTISNNLFTRDTALEVRVSSVETRDTALEVRVSALEDESPSRDTALEVRVSSLESRDTALEIRVSSVETRDTALEVRVSSLEKRDTALEVRVSSAETRDTALEVRVTSLEVNGIAALATAAFGELLAVQPSPVVQLQFPYNINSRYVTTSLTGSGTATQANSLLLLQTGAANNSSATIKSKSRLQYQPGQGATCLFTAIYTAGVANSTQITGIGNDADGFFFGFNGADFGILHRNSSSGSLVDTWIPQTSWNIDKFNGSGSSGVTLDPTTGNVFKIQFQWLGFGVISFYIENKATGEFVLVHQIQYPNSNTVPSISNPSLQIMSQVINTTNTSNITLKNASLGAFTEGLVANIDERNNISNSKSGFSTTNTNIVTIKNNTTFQTKTNQVTVFPDMTSFFDSPSGSGDALFTIVLNATLGGTPSYTDINASTSVVSYDTAGTTVSGGTVLFSFYVPNGTTFTFNMFDFNVLLVPGDTLTLACQSTTASSITVYASMSWIERF